MKRAYIIGYGITLFLFVLAGLCYIYQILLFVLIPLFTFLLFGFAISLIIKVIEDKDWNK